MRLARSALVCTALLASAVAASAPAAYAKGPAPAVTTASTLQCDAPLSSPLFAAWGDDSLYAPFAGSTFESADAPWSTSGGAGVVSGDDDQAFTTSGTHAMQIPGKGTATSPTMCVDSTMPSMRFFIRRTAGTGNLTIVGTLGDGKHAESATLATVSGTSTWTPTPPIVFPSSLATLVGTGSLNVQFQFVADPGSTFRIDDIAMDPYRRT